MMLTPQAYRLVSAAVRAYPQAHAKQVWESWWSQFDWSSIRTFDNPGSSMPIEIATIAHDALSYVAGLIERRLDTEKLSDEQEADLVNELGFIMAIESDLAKAVAGELPLARHA